MHWLYRKSRSTSSSDLGFHTDDVKKKKKNDVIVCKLDVNENNRTVGAGSIVFFKLEYNLFRWNKGLLLQHFLNKTESAIFVSLMCSLLPKDHHAKLILFFYENQIW